MVVLVIQLTTNLWTYFGRNKGQLATACIVLQKEMPCGYSWMEDCMELLLQEHVL